MSQFSFFSLMLSQHGLLYALQHASADDLLLLLQKEAGALRESNPSWVAFNKRFAELIEFGLREQDPRRKDIQAGIELFNASLHEDEEDEEDEEAA